MMIKIISFDIGGTLLINDNNDKNKIIYSDESLERMVIKIKEDNLSCIRIKDGQGISKYSNER